VTSTQRFSARPAAVSFEATGSTVPIAPDPKGQTHDSVRAECAECAVPAEEPGIC
jgi:hypothetical protein